MGYIDQNLMKDENIIFRTRMSNFVFITPAVILMISIALFILKYAIRNNPDFNDPLGGMILVTAFIFLFFSATAFITAIITVMTSEIGVTNKRVLIKIGLFAKKSLETLLDKIESIEVQQNIIEQVFNSGSVIVKGSGGTSSPFTNILNPYEFRKKVQEQIESIKK